MVITYIVRALSMLPTVLMELAIDLDDEEVEVEVPPADWVTRPLGPFA